MHEASDGSRRNAWCNEERQVVEVGGRTTAGLVRQGRTTAAPVGQGRATAGLVGQGRT